MSDAKIVVTTIYFDPKYADKDRASSEIYQNENEKIVDDLMYALEGFVVHTSIFRDKQAKLIEHLNNQDYGKFYKTIEKAVKKAQKDL